jgi:hypothetical protein
MTKNEFISLCAMLYVSPSLALENDRVLTALREQVSMDEMEEILSEEF